MTSNSKGHDKECFENIALFSSPELDDYGLTPGEYRVYCYVAHQYVKNSEECCEAMPTIASNCKMTLRKTQKAVRVLAKAGLIHQTRGVGAGGTHKLKPQSVCEWKDPSTAASERKIIKSRRFAVSASK